MFQHPVLKATALLLGVLLVACNAPTAQQLSPTPASPPTQTVPIKASRVVALTSLSADIIHRLDKTKLIGMSGSRLLSQNPEFTQVTKVSEGRSQPNLEKIVALKPDFVIGAAGFHDPIVSKLQAMGIKTMLTKVDSWQSLNDLTSTIATILQSDPQPLLRHYQTFIKPTDQPASTLVLVSRQPILAPNKSSWAGDLMTRFGTKNLVAELQGQSQFGGYITLSAEKVLQANPEVLILVDTGQGEAEKFKSEPFWSKLNATQRNQVYVFDYYGLVNPGSIDAIEKACIQLRKIFT
ncbi:MAG: ABC transporter substrate-binding protein [Leptolyngbyaceae cyanobacterium CSU_1_3]|nr:ABC transporter substrate-binding protein [Leptolyngbyaceae cyanobacterium CSU_1_3]